MAQETDKRRPGHFDNDAVYVEGPSSDSESQPPKRPAASANFLGVYELIYPADGGEPAVKGNDTDE